MRRAAKVDDNQPQIVKALRRSGAFVIITSQLKGAFDLLVIYQGVIYIVEVKDGSKTKSRRQLTEGEEICRHGVESHGAKYHIIESVDDALNMIGATAFPPRVMCASHRPHGLGYIAFFEDAERRHKEGQRQTQCIKCNFWFWPDEMYQV